MGNPGEELAERILPRDALMTYGEVSEVQLTMRGNEQLICRRLFGVVSSSALHEIENTVIIPYVWPIEDKVVIEDVEHGQVDAGRNERKE